MRCLLWVSVTSHNQRCMPHLPPCISPLAPSPFYTVLLPACSSHNINSKFQSWKSFTFYSKTKERNEINIEYLCRCRVIKPPLGTSGSSLRITYLPPPNVIYANSLYNEIYYDIPKIICHYVKLKLRYAKVIAWLLFDSIWLIERQN